MSLPTGGTYKAGFFMFLESQTKLLFYLLNENVDSHVTLSFHERRKERPGGDGTQPRDKNK